MQIEIEPANEVQHDQLLRNLYQLYLYEYSRFTQEWRVGEDGRFPETDLEDCWSDPHAKVFLFRVDGAWAGLAIVYVGLGKEETGKFNELAEFFIMPPYRRQRVGETVARRLFDQFKGRWLLSVLATNLEGLHFWRSLLDRYTNGQFTIRPDDDPDEEAFLHEFTNLSPSSVS
jgi:predicted acetyltransferase